LAARITYDPVAAHKIFEAERPRELYSIGNAAIFGSDDMQQVDTEVRLALLFGESTLSCIVRKQQTKRTRHSPSLWLAGSSEALSSWAMCCKGSAMIGQVHYFGLHEKLVFCNTAVRYRVGGTRNRSSGGWMELREEVATANSKRSKTCSTGLGSIKLDARKQLMPG
jgi:hypothetical protein